MNNKDIKKRLQEQAISEMPDVFNKINIQEIEIEAVERPVRKIRLSFNFKLALSSFLVLLTSFFVYQLLITPETEGSYLTEVEVLAFQTVSAQSLLEYNSEEINPLSYTLSESNTEASDLEGYLGDMTPLIELAEMIVNQRSQITYQLLESDLSEYQFKVNFKAINLNQESVEYDIYYNQTNEAINGIIQIGEDTYNFTQNDSRYILYENDQDFIEVSQSKTNEFSYNYMKSQVEQFSTRINLSLEEESYQAEFSYQNNKGLSISLNMRRNQGTMMDVDYDISDQAKNMRGRYQVSIEEDQITGNQMYKFKFSDESVAEQEKPGRPNQNNPGMGPRHTS